MKTKYTKLTCNPQSCRYQEALVRRAFRNPYAAIREIIVDASRRIFTEYGNDDASILGEDTARMLSVVCDVFGLQSDKRHCDAKPADAVAAYWRLETAPRNWLCDLLVEAGYAG